MIKIPQNGKYNQPNNSDLFGNIWYTKNINLDEEGYIKLAPRAFSVINTVSDSNFGVPTSIGRYYENTFNVVSSGEEYLLGLDESAYIAQDAGGSVPSPALHSHGIWYNKLWHVTTTTALFSKDMSTGDWTSRKTGYTNGVAHPLCSFEKSATILVGNGNAVAQYNSSYSATGYGQLTIGADYEIIGIAYNNNLAAIATRLSATVEGENKEAQLFIWDGAGSSANYAYGVGSDACIAIAPYKSSFVILTRAGQLKYFNGGGFDDLANFPVYYKDAQWGEFSKRINYGDSMTVECDLIYININSKTEDYNQETFIEEFIGGIWVYDPVIGLYHRASPSITQATVVMVADSGVDTTNNIMTISGYQIGSSLPNTGSQIRAVSTTIGGLHEGLVYYIIKVSSTTFKLATTYANAMAGTAVDLTSVGGFYSYFMTATIVDYGQSYVSTGGVVSITGNKEYTHDDFIFGGKYYKTTSVTTSTEYLNITVSGFKNIGYFITPKIYSQNVEDIYKKLFLKYRPLKSDDSIILKYKNKEYVGIPEQATCTVTSTTTMTTTSYIPYSYGSTEELECEIIAGSGAGQMIKVSSITESSGTYTITLDENVDGWTIGDVCKIKLDNWKILETITSSDSENWKEIPIADNSKWLKVKVVLVGTNVSVEELQIINSTHLPSA